MAEKKRVFAPTILETKQDLLLALKAGQLRVSKYNTLSDNQKMFVELIVFGEYSAEQAVRVIEPNIFSPKMVANRMMSDPDIMAVIDELTESRDKNFMQDAMSARNVALSKLEYIMKTSKDEGLQLAAAKTILEKTNDYMKAKRAKDEEDKVTQVQYNIKVDQMTVNTSPNGEPIIIPSDEVGNAPPVSINPETGLPYALMYEGVNNYGGNYAKQESQQPTDAYYEVSGGDASSRLDGGMAEEAIPDGLVDNSEASDDGEDERGIL